MFKIERKTPVFSIVFISAPVFSIVFISDLGLIFHFNFQFTRPYFWMWKLCFHVASALFFPFHYSYKDKFWYIYVIGIETNKKLPPHPVYSNPPLIIFHWIFQPRSLLRPQFIWDLRVLIYIPNSFPLCNILMVSLKVLLQKTG